MLKECIKDLRIASIEYNSIVDGIGLRYVIFTQGCPHHCLNCHNPETWDFRKGRVINTDMIKAQIKNDPLLTGVTFSGGEPFMQPEPLIDIANFVHEIGLTVWCYTGFKYEDLFSTAAKMHKGSEMLHLLECIDVLVDGPFENDKKSYELKFKGSSNQRIIDVQKSLRTGTIILLEGI